MITLKMLISLLHPSIKLWILCESEPTFRYSEYVKYIKLENLKNYLDREVILIDDDSDDNDSVFLITIK